MGHAQVSRRVTRKIAPKSLRTRAITRLVSSYAVPPGLLTSLKFMNTEIRRRIVDYTSIQYYWLLCKFSLIKWARVSSQIDACAKISCDFTNVVFLGFTTVRASGNTTAQYESPVAHKGLSKSFVQCNNPQSQHEAQRDRKIKAQCKRNLFFLNKTFPQSHSYPSRCDASIVLPPGFGSCASIEFSMTPLSH